jgi:hypothetical protein
VKSRANSTHCVGGGRPPPVKLAGKNPDECEPDEAGSLLHAVSDAATAKLIHNLHIIANVADSKRKVESKVISGETSLIFALSSNSIIPLRDPIACELAFPLEIDDLARSVYSNAKANFGWSC